MIRSLSWFYILCCRCHSRRCCCYCCWWRKADIHFLDAILVFRDSKNFTWWFSIWFFSRHTHAHTPTNQPRFVYWPHKMFVVGVSYLCYIEYSARFSCLNIYLKRKKSSDLCVNRTSHRIQLNRMNHDCISNQAHKLLH